MKLRHFKARYKLLLKNNKLFVYLYNFLNIVKTPIFSFYTFVDLFNTYKEFSKLRKSRFNEKQKNVLIVPLGMVPSTKQEAIILQL